MPTEEKKKKIVNRLRTIQGHISGIEKMIEEGKVVGNEVVLEPFEHADGGTFGPDLYGNLPGLDWRKLTKTFLKTE